MKTLQCHCCGYYTISGEDEVVVDICDVCLWQYDRVAHENPNRIIGPNRVSLNEARANYQMFGVSKIRLKDKNLTREPFPEEIRGNE